MEAFADQFIHLIEAHRAWAAPIIGLIAFGESLVLIGILLPGTAVLLFAGGLVGSGLIHPVPVLLCAIVGAVLGDTLSYLLGIWLGRGFVNKWPLNRYRTAFARARLFFRRYGFATVFIGRFFGPVRSAVPTLAGMLGMDVRRFQVANVLSAIVWAPVVLSPGWLVARGAANFLELGEADWLGLAAVAIAVLVVIGFVSARLFQRRGRRRRQVPAE